MTRPFLCLLSTLILAGCASVDSSVSSRSAAGADVKSQAPGLTATSTALNPQQARVTDGRLQSDTDSLAQVQQRLRKLSEAGVAQNNYPMAKAQCWLDTATTQYRENDRTGYIEESLAESVKIVEQLERNKAAAAGFDTPLVARSTMLRSDLWGQLGKFKANTAALACNARTVACAEVRLVRAGHADEQTGWRSSLPHIKMVEDAIRIAGNEATSCVVSVAQAAPIPRVAPAAAAPAMPVATAPALVNESFVLLSDALFKFNKSGSQDLLPGGQQRLGELAERLKNYKSIGALTIIGHTDRLGTDDYNLRLSQRRADTVKAYFEQRGLKPATWNARGQGEREPVVQGCDDKLRKEALIQCLQADRRVTIEVTGTTK
ncbi:MAG: OmpA family protein [Burkholderiaceae bacterium]